ncbi:MAG: cytochrome P450 [Candidatus Promineofilum sp.]|nr:cytochrome P450 [Promineifilum sp.]
MFDTDVVDSTSEASWSSDAMMRVIAADMGLEMLLPRFIPTPGAHADGLGRPPSTNCCWRSSTSAASEGSDRDDLLTMLMAARDDERQLMSTAQLLDEIRTPSGRLRDHVATALSWARHLPPPNSTPTPSWKPRDEALAGRTPIADDVPQLRFANAAIREILRRYPVAWVNTQRRFEDVAIRGCHIAKDTAIWLSPWLVHRDARWYDEPGRLCARTLA